MMDFLKILVLFYTVWSSFIKAQERQYPYVTDSDKWIWGQAEKIPETIITRFGAGQTEAKPEACSPYDPPMPDFKKPGRRISEVVCQEYIWKNKVISEKLRRALSCETKQQQFNFTIGTGAEFNDYFIGGRTTAEKEFPHMGALGWRGSTIQWVFKCGGSLITSKYVLTAAHCSKTTEDDTEITDLEPKIVRFGHANIASSTTYNDDVEILKIIPHPSYKSPSRDHDVALLELRHAVTFTDAIKPACLWGRPDTNTFGTIGTVTGWGVLKKDSRDTSPQLQAGELDIIDNDKCDELLLNLRNRNWNGVSSNQICAGNLKGGIDSCRGDSGGPMQVKVNVGSSNVYYVIGVTSFGYGCAYAGIPGLYTRVSSYLDWIESVVWP